MNIAYVRVSSNDQHTDRQEFALKNYNIDKYYIEKISGKNMNRPELKNMLEYVREGDTLYIESFSRLARSLVDLLSIVDTLQKKKVAFVSLKESIDTTTPAGRLQLAVIGAISEFERETLKERQREGIEIALAQKRPYGRPQAKITDKLRKAYQRWKKGEITAGQAMKSAEVKRTTFYKLAKQLDEELRGLSLENY